MTKKNPATITVYANKPCGCCKAEMQFRSLEAAQKAFEKAGLSSTARIRDDARADHVVDTFYGCWTDENEQRGLAYLAEKALS